MSLTNPDAIVTEERLAEFYQTIFPYLGGMPDILANKFAKGDMYSTDEKMIGRWIDGKPLYQKTVDFGALPKNNASTKQVEHGILNLDYIVNVKSMAKDSNSGFSIMINDTSRNSLAAQVRIYFDATYIYSAGGADIDLSSYNAYITLQYTKTTDSAVYIGDDTDYSTDEKIVGTWIDGKPIYQRTYQTTTPAEASGTSYIDVTDLGIDKIVRLDGIIDASGTNTHQQINVNWSYALNGNSGAVFYQTSEKRIYIFLGPQATAYLSTPVYVTIQYTKTTD